MTSVEQDPRDGFALPLTSKDLAQGKLARPSWVRTDKLFTIDQALVRKAVAKLNEETLQETRRLAGSLVQGMRP